MLVRMLRKRISSALLVGMQTGAGTLENSVEVPQKTKNRTTLWPSNCTSRHLSTGYRCAVLKGHMHPHVYSSTINNSQSMERAQMSIDGWMDKDVVYIHNGVLLSNQKEWNLGAPGWLSQLTEQLQLRSWSRSPWVWAPRWALCWQCRTCLGLSLSPCLSASSTHTLSLSLSQKKLNVELPYNPAIALLGIYPRDIGVLFRRDTYTPMFIAALSTTAKVWKEPKCPSI